MIAAITAVLLLAFVSSASAECAWVLWFTSGRTVDITSPAEAHATKKECEQAMLSNRDKLRDYKARNPEDFAYYRCLPDTVDPRGPKGSG